MTETISLLPSESGKTLREKAEERAREIIADIPKNLETRPPEEIRQAFYELRVHQIELEMQNDELCRTQTELEVSRARYFDLFDQAPVGYCILSEEGLILEANLAAAAMLGVTRDGLVKQSFISHILKADQDTSYLYSKQIFSTGKPQVCELRMVKKDGALFWVRLEATAVQNEGGAPVFRIMMSDITAGKQADEELLKSQKIESLGLLAGGIAHDFNNILMVVMGNISFAKMLLNPKDAAYERLTIAETASLRAKELTQQFLTFSKGGAPVKKLFSAANMLKVYCRLALSGTQSTCEYNIADDLWDINGDDDQLGQVMTNLLINADQSMQAGGVIRVNCRNMVSNEDDDLPLPSGKYLEISITDQGRGIPEEYLDKIFDPYFTTKETGQGLGLTAVYSIMNKHGGHVAVASSVHSGTNVTLFLPASTSLAKTPKMESSKIITGKGKILIMDDDEVLLQVVDAMLVHLGYEVERAGDGTVAITKYIEAQQSARPFDAVIMDLTVPGGMGGKETMQRLLAIDPQAKAIVSSGYCHDPVMADYRNYGFSGVIAKPYLLEALSKLMQQVLQS